ncbi:uncharacterized protein EKO05_0007193 [Ascochyta rabiei]|uniref:Uncharacterized protein n=1 Tax=Didymella rabiei TaxID=5454 RepID=A0A162ZMN7_DIDRA|nr:uncharacterized protein EKO05_0007193 [Ascochyta rabiei]KZM20702.1 hypothetical protein ST47_g8185 [Ascochyta rabiei]UPX16808.1 hypothetical protein EKO05_0007193 [Ascochyta rabiei]
MAAAEYYSGACMEFVPKHLLSPTVLQRAQTELLGKRTDNVEVAQGRIMWLPSVEGLPERAVRRAHGKGVVEDGIYNHPVVVVSRPLDDERVVHFHLITSLHGKKLDQLYPKSNEFHTSRRSWYLPISPSPDHPDAHSKKAKKRFPTLALADGATLRWDSYVNIRHVYKIDWTLLKPYVNLNTPGTSYFRLDWESTVRMIAKGKILTLYEPSAQVLVPEIQKARTAPTTRTSNDSASYMVRDMRRLSPSESEDESTALPAASRTSRTHGLTFWTSNDRRTDPLPEELPNIRKKPSFLDHLRKKLFRRGRKLR